MLGALGAKMVRAVGLLAYRNYFEKKKKKDLYEWSFTMDFWTCPTPLGLLILVQASVKILTKSPAVFGPSSCFAPNVGFCAHGVGGDNWTTQRVRRRKIAKKFLKASNIYLSSSFFLFFLVNNIYRSSSVYPWEKDGVLIQLYYYLK